MKTVTNYAQWFNLEVTRVADDAWKRLMAPERTERLYLYGKRGGLTVALDGAGAPEGYELVTPEPFPENMERRYLGTWIHDRASRFPCLPEEG